jgi:hypothetical protein
MKLPSLAAALAIVAVAQPFSPLTARLSAATAAQASTSRDQTRDQLRELLATAGANNRIDIDFRQSTKNPYSVVGFKHGGMTNSEALEAVWSVTKDETIALRVYPHYNGGYINIGRARDPAGLMRKLLQLNSTNFMFWGADETGDVFAGYEFTMESGFPSEAVIVVARSITNQDQFVGQLKPFIGTAPAAKK